MSFCSRPDKKVKVRVGTPISAETVRNAGTDRDATGYLRWRTYLLAQRGHAPHPLPPALRAVFLHKKQEPVRPPVPTENLLEDLSKLSAGTLLRREQGLLRLRRADPEEMPNLLAGSRAAA